MIKAKKRIDHLECGSGAESILIQKQSICDLTPIEKDVMVNSEDGNIQEDSSEQMKEPEVSLSRGQLRRKR